MGKAINKAVTIAEILKRKVPLHQITTLSSCEIVNVYEPLEEGLDTVVNQHYVSCLTITLSEDSAGIDVNDKGYQVSRLSPSLTASLYACKIATLISVFVPTLFVMQPPLSPEEIHGGDVNAPILPDIPPKAGHIAYGTKT